VTLSLLDTLIVLVTYLLTYPGHYAPHRKRFRFDKYIAKKSVKHELVAASSVPPAFHKQ